jgi:syntaxin-binding protein 1
VKEKEAVLGESDSLWVEMRHMFIAEVYTTLAARFNEFHSKNKAAKQLGGERRT